VSITGKFLYTVYHRPVGVVRQCLAEGGPLEQRRTAAGRAEMIEAARQLPTLPAASGRPLELHLLTGSRFWDQTAFCLWTFARHSRRALAPVIYDDGSLKGEHRDAIARLFPSAQFVPQRDAIAKLDHFLPANRFPVLRERWRNYPNIRKLIDPHIGASGWKLVIDSDLLFFRAPAALVEWLDAPSRPLHAIDCETSYGYSRTLMNELAGHAVGDLINVGLTGLNSSELDWARIESMCATLIEREKPHYYLEQALIAMLVAGRTCTVAAAADYVTYPKPPEAADCLATMHHYVAGSKRWYFQHSWRRALEQQPSRFR
jgi:hypothetical protein